MKIDIDDETLKRIIQADLELRIPKINQILWDDLYPGTGLTGDEIIAASDKIEAELMNELVSDIIARLKSY